MNVTTVVGVVLVLGLVCFMVGAVAWKSGYERPLAESLPVIHADRVRRAWIHVWMIVGTILTSAGLLALALVATPRTGAAALVAVASGIYLVGACCWIPSMVFRLTIVPDVASEVVRTGVIPDGFRSLSGWASGLYVLHMLTAYCSSAILGVAVLQLTALPTWLGWVGVIWGLLFAAGFVATRFAGPFNPPFWAHVFTAAVGVALLA